MYSSGPPPPMPMIPATNFCPPPVYGNVPFPQQYAPYYPPICNYYSNPAPGPYNLPNSKATGSQLPNYNPAPQMPIYSQPPPGYGVNGAQICQNACNNTAAPPYQPVHMANVRSTSFNGVPAPGATPVNNNFGRLPPTSPQMNGKQAKNYNRFSTHRNNRQGNNSQSSPYFCETCDRGFPSLDLFTKHNSEHITCGAEGCTFKGHVKIVEKHFMMQHRSGLFNRIVKGYSPEEIKKWITDRKKHFPTKEKVEVKQAQREEMQKRGERYAEQKRQFNERNNFKSGPNSRFNRSNAAPRRNGRFPSRPFNNRENFTRNNVRKEPRTLTNDDCVLRKILPFRGTNFHLNGKTDTGNDEPEEHIVSDDEYSVFSGDEDVVVIDKDETVPKKNVISELEKCYEPSQPVENSEEDCLDKYFKNCDIEDENDEKTEKCDTTDKNTTCITDSTIDDTKTRLPSDSLVKRSTTPDPSANEEPDKKGVGALALIQCYDSDSNDEEDSTELVDGQIVAPAVIETESKKLDSIDDPKCDENSLKCIPVVINDRQSCSSPLKMTESNENDSSDDGGPDECSSKSVPTETIIPPSDSSSMNKPQSEKPEPVPCSSKSSNEADKDSESKRRKRKRRKDSKGEAEANEVIEEKTEEKLPAVFRPRKKYKPPTLLEKLLAPEIKHERNVVLQCIRYVVQNDFFQVGKSDSA